MATVGLTIEIDSEGNVTGIERVEQGRDGVEKNAQQATREVEEVGRSADRLMATGAAAGGAFLGVLGGMTMQAARYGDEIAKASTKTGIATEALSGLRYAAGQSGVAFGELEMGLARMQRRADEAAQGSDSAQQAFGRLGVEVRDASGRARDGEAIFRDVAEALSHVDNETERAALAMEIFGRSGANLIPLLAEGSEGIDRLTERAEALGIVLDSESAEAAERFNDSLADLKMGAQGVGMAIAQTLMPSLSENNEAIAEATGRVAAWVGENEGAVRVLVTLGALLSSAAIGIYAINKAIGMLQATKASIQIILKYFGKQTAANTAALQAETGALTTNTAAANANAAAHGRAGGARAAGGAGKLGVGGAVGLAGTAIGGGLVGWGAAGRAQDSDSALAQAGYGAGGVLGGAAVGAAIGSVVPGVGTVVGAGVGGAAGGVVGTSRMMWGAIGEAGRGAVRKRRGEAYQAELAAMSPEERRAFVAQRAAETELEPVGEESARIMRPAAGGAQIPATQTGGLPGPASVGGGGTTRVVHEHRASDGLSAEIARSPEVQSMAEEVYQRQARGG